MNTCFKKVFLVFTVFFVSLISFTATAKAGEVKVSKYDVNAVILDDGSISIKEDLTYSFNGKYNGAYKDISIQGTDGLENLKVYMIEGNNLIPYKQVDTGNADKGDDGVYEVIKNDTNSYKVKIYSPSRNEEKTFRLNYELLNVAIKYNDTAEFYYKFWDKYNDTQIDNFTINVTVPSDAGNNGIKVFAHGPENGKYKILDNQRVQFYVPHVPSKTFVEARILFPKALLSYAKNIKNENALNRILSEEESFRNMENAKAAKNAAIQKIFNYISLGTSVFMILIVFFVFNKFKRPELKDYSISLIPEECTPALASYLYHKMLSGKDILATLMDLWRKGYLKVEPVSAENPSYNYAYETNKKSKNQDYKIIKTKESDSFLLKHERYFMKWFFDEIGDCNYVYMSDIKHSSQKSNYMNQYNEWINYVKDEAKARHYFDKSAIPYGISLICLFVATFPVSIMSIIFHSLWGIVSVVLSITLLIVGIFLTMRRSDYGEEQFLKWKKFIKHMEECHYNADLLRNMPEDEFLPYAIALGVNEKSLLGYKNHVSVKYQDTASWLYMYFLIDDFDSKHSFRNDFCGAVGSSFTSTSGSFSSGGGGGAGGGGAGGF